MKLKYLLLIIFALASFLCFLGNVSAQDYFSGGRGSNLLVKEGDIAILEEDLEIKLHVGFAEVNQTYRIQNSQTNEQKVNFGFSFFQDNKTNGVDNVAAFSGSTPLELVSSQEVIEGKQVQWKYFTLTFAPNEVKSVFLSHWQLNGANFRGLRTFDFQLSGKKQTIGKLNINLILGDQITTESFNKTSNPDLDLRLSPVGANTQANGFSWSFINIDPAFDLQANFYWPNGDLAKISHLNKNLGLYSVLAPNNESASHLTDSSYLTAFKGSAFSSTLGEQIKIEFDSPRPLNQILIIPGVADSQDNFLKANKPRSITLTFDNGTTQAIELENKFGAQIFGLKEVTSQNVQISINSVFAGSDPKDTTISIAEVEFKNHKENDSLPIYIAEPIRLNFWQKCALFFQNIFNWLKSIF